MKNRHFFKTFFIFLLIGLIGIVSVIPTIRSLIKQQMETIPNAPHIPTELLVPLSLINPLILLIIAILIGMLTAPKVQLKSFIYDWINNKQQSTTSFKSYIGLGVLSGVIVALIFFVLELPAQPYLPDALKMTQESRDLSTTVGGIFYGGITEELLLRWGMMSFFVWVFWKLFQRSKPSPSTAVYWISILLSAVLFALGHYGATAILTPVTTIIWIRMLLLNGLGAVVFGWLYWKKGLEVAFISHACVHITTTIIMQIWFLVI